MQPSLGRAPRATVRIRAALTCLLVCGVIALIGSCMPFKPNGPAGGGGYSESGLRSIKGVQISTSGYETTFRIPVLQALQGDREILFNQITKNYVEAMADLRKTFNTKKASVTGFEKVAAITEYNDQIRELVNRFAIDLDKNQAAKVDAERIAQSQKPEIYSDVTKENLIQSYLPPGQAIALFAGANFKVQQRAVNALSKLGVNKIVVNVALVYIVQAFVVVTIDNHTQKERLDSNGVPKRGYQIDGAMYLVPSGGAGLSPGTHLTGSDLAGVAPQALPNIAAGCNRSNSKASLEAQLGIGLLFGPLSTPHDLMGYAGANFDIDTGAVKKGWYGRFLALGKFGKAPIFIAFAGWEFGCSSASMTVSLTAFMDPQTFVGWINGGAKPDEIKDAGSKRQPGSATDENFENAKAELSL